ncbi:unnamed protein product [Closterium sp. NIES-65]|nr:unnamed protein product [Closterium sp. NIES-65]
MSDADTRSMRLVPSFAPSVSQSREVVSEFRTGFEGTLPPLPDDIIEAIIEYAGYYNYFATPPLPPPPFPLLPSPPPSPPFPLLPSPPFPLLIPTPSLPTHPPPPFLVFGMSDGAVIPKTKTPTTTRGHSLSSQE